MSNVPIRNLDEDILYRVIDFIAGKSKVRQKKMNIVNMNNYFLERSFLK